MEADWLELALARISAGMLLPADYFAGLDCDAALEARDDDEDFDQAWTEIDREVERRWAKGSVNEETRSVVEDIRREAFLAVSRATQQHEIASYVSDDLNLIAWGRVLGVDDRFLDQLWDCYNSGRFPLPPL